jgi:hypothetical protein
LIPRISAIFWRHRRRYGARRIAVELARVVTPAEFEEQPAVWKKENELSAQPEAPQMVGKRVNLNG